MPRGGARPGAGRKKGAATKKTVAIANVAAEQGITPLEVMIEAMRSHHAAKRLDEAAAIAKDAAPYMHPRLNATQLSGGLSVRQLVVEEVIDADDQDEDTPPPDSATLS
jgi:hypothetical protein